MKKRNAEEEHIEENALIEEEREIEEIEEIDRAKAKVEVCHCDEEDECNYNYGSIRMRLAHAYVPWQRYDDAFSPQEALKKGTLFPCLYGAYPIPR